MFVTLVRCEKVFLKVGLLPAFVGVCLVAFFISVQEILPMLSSREFLSPLCSHQEELSVTMSYV